MKRKKIVYIISDVDKSAAFEWQLSALAERYRFSVILLNTKADTALAQFLEEKNIPFANIKCGGKKDWLQAFFRTMGTLRKWKPDIVHCHLLQANIVGLAAAWALRVPCRVYTRHHSTEHHVFHPRGVYWDKLCNRLATTIIAISNVVKKVLVEWEKVPSEKVVLIPHGFKLEKFNNVDPGKMRAIQNKYALGDRWPVIGVISRFTSWKGVQYIIPAFKHLLSDYPDAVLMLLNAEGDYKTILDAALGEIPDRNKRVILFESEIASIYKNMDVFVHVPENEYAEAFGQIYVEALAADVPSIFTLSGIASEFIQDRHNALVVGFKDADGIYLALKKLLRDKELQEQLKHNGQQSIVHYSFNRLLNDLIALYR